MIKREIKLFDALDNLVKPIKDQQVSMYVCGPTTYNRIHIGNLRPLVFYDFLARFFKRQGYEVKYLSNMTDIDDKIIDSFEKNPGPFKNYLEYSAYYGELFLKTYDDYDLEKPFKFEKVSTSLDKIVSFLDRLEQNDATYLLKNDLIFDTSKVKYGLLANRDLSKNKVNESKNSLNKKSNSDFVLWKKTKDETHCTKWSCGRPGWHSECATFIADHFDNQTITIHGGGIDLKFPHHENERVQYEVATGNRLAEIFSYVGHVFVGEEKMSKSLNNFIYADELKESLDKNIIKMIILFSNYKKPFEFSEQNIIYYTKLFNKLKNILLTTEFTNELDFEMDYLDQFENYISNDFNMQNALMSFEQALKKFNQNPSQIKLNKIKTMVEILGLKI